VWLLSKSPHFFLMLGKVDPTLKMTFFFMPAQNNAYASLCRAQHRRNWPSSQKLERHIWMELRESSEYSRLTRRDKIGNNWGWSESE
jgi:hypothetical protein